MKIVARQRKDQHIIGHGLLFQEGAKKPFLKNVAYHGWTTKKFLGSRKKFLVFWFLF